MTADAIRDEVMERTGQTSTEASTRILRLLNEHHREVTAAIGLNTSRRGKVWASTTAASNTVVFANIENIEVLKKESVTPNIVLHRVPYEEIQEMRPESRTSVSPRHYAIKSQDAIGITIALSHNATSAFVLWAHGMLTVSDLVDVSQPLLPQSFHFILKERVLADEYLRKEKKDMAAIAIQRATQGLSDLKMFIAKNGFLDIQQGSSVNSESGFHSRSGGLRY